MRQFAKLFGPPDDQLLVRIDVNLVRFETDLEIAFIEFPPDTGGRLAARMLLHRLNEETARAEFARIKGSK